MLVNRIFSFSHHISNPSTKRIHHVTNIIIHHLPNCFLYGPVKNFVLRWSVLNPLPHMPILESSKSAANKDRISKIWKNGDIIIWLSRKHCGKRRNCLLQAISPFRTMFSKAVQCWCIKMSICGVKDICFLQTVISLFQQAKSSNSSSLMDTTG